MVDAGRTYSSLNVGLTVRDGYSLMRPIFGTMIEWRRI